VDLVTYKWKENLKGRRRRKFLCKLILLNYREPRKSREFGMETRLQLKVNVVWFHE
jgi:hypothetical protein